MSTEERIRQGSYKGVPFDTFSVDRGKVKKNTEHQFANSSRRYIEERGVQEPDYNVTLSIFGEGAEYFEKRDGLRSALESEGEGVLVLPMEGEFNVKCTSVSDKQNIVESLGRCDFVCTFKVISENEKAGNPIQVTNSKITLANNVANLRSNIANIVNNNIVISSAFNYSKSLSKYTNFAQRMARLASNTLSGSNSLNGIIGKFSDGLSLLLGEPILLGSAVNAVFNEFEKVFDVASILFSSSEALFAFGDTDTKVSPNTPTKAELDKNQQISNAQIQIEAVGIASNAVGQMEFTNEEELEKTENKIIAQLDKIENSDFMKNSDIDGVADLSYILKELRNNISDVFEEKRNTTPKIVDINTIGESVSLLSYKYYGSMDNVESLIELNNIQNPKAIKGIMRAYSNVGQ